ncbi:hypothetical protein B484DRAFT_465187, partial [Ochromonadaceae sp. CCMP2298]
MGSEISPSLLFLPSCRACPSRPRQASLRAHAGFQAPAEGHIACRRGRAISGDDARCSRLNKRGETRNREDKEQNDAAEKRQRLDELLGARAAAQEAAAGQAQALAECAELRAEWDGLVMERDGLVGERDDARAQLLEALTTLQAKTSELAVEAAARAAAEQMLTTKQRIINDIRAKCGRLQARLRSVYNDAEAIVKEGSLIEALVQNLKAAAAEMVSPSVINTHNFPALKDYLHGPFIEKVRSKAPILCELLECLLDAFTNNLPSDRMPLWATLREHHYAHSLAWLLQRANKAFSWEYATLQQIMIRGVARSAIVTNQIAMNLAGAPNTVTLTRRTEAYCTFRRAKGRGGVDLKRKPTIVTAFMVQHYLPENGDEGPPIQQQMKHSSQNDRTVEALLPLPPGERYLHRLTTAVLPDEQLSELEILEEEVTGYCCFLEAAASAGAGAAAPVSPAQAPTKLCPGCREREWPMSRLVCRRDEGGCGSKLNADKMHRESIHSTAPQHVASEVGGSTYFANADAALREQKGVSKSFTAVTPGIRRFSRGGDDAVDPAENDWSPNYRKEILLPLIAKVRGFTKAGEEPAKEWVSFAADLGACACIFKHLDRDKKVHTLNYKYSCWAGTELTTLMRQGNLGLEKFLEGKFGKLPTRVRLRSEPEKEKRGAAELTEHGAVAEESGDSDDSDEDSDGEDAVDSWHAGLFAEVEGQEYDGMDRSEAEEGELGGRAG